MQVTDEMVDAALDAYYSTDNAPFARPDVCMRAALTAALAAMQDHVIVPREPTLAMLGAAYHLAAEVFPAVHGPHALYLAMIAAAPSQLSKRDDAERDSIQEA